MEASSLDLSSSLNISGYNLLLKANSIVRCHEDLYIGKNSTLEMDCDSQILDNDLKSINSSALINIMMTKINIFDGIVHILHYSRLKYNSFGYFCSEKGY